MKFKKKNYFNTLTLPLFLPYAIIYHFINFGRFIFIRKFYIWSEKSIASDEISHVTCMALRV